MLQLVPVRGSIYLTCNMKRYTSSSIMQGERRGKGRKKVAKLVDQVSLASEGQQRSIYYYALTAGTLLFSARG